MKNLKRSTFALSILIALLCVTGCDLRAGKGEDLHKANKSEVRAIKENLVYFTDDYGNCFAALNNYTDGFRSTFTLASIDCNRMP